MGSTPINTGYSTKFATTGISPPNSIYISPDDQLFFYVVPSVVCTLRIGIRYLLPTGEIKVGEYDMTTSATRTPQAMIQTLGEGFILGINVFCLTQALRRGQCWVKFVLQRGGLNVQQLTQTICQGYVTEYTSLFWPSAQTDYELAGRGSIRSITGATPAAGAEVTETVPTGAAWRLISWSMILTTSSTVANRTVRLLIDDGTNFFYAVTEPQVIAASTPALCVFFDGATHSALANNAPIAPLPSNNRLAAGYRIRTSSLSLQANDQYGSIQYLVEEWLQP